MAVDLMGCYAPHRADDQIAIQEAAAAGLRSLELLVSTLSPAAAPHANRPAPTPLGEIADQAVSKFRRVISILDRTGHARFRRGPAEIPKPPPPAPPSVAQPSPPPPQSLTLDFTKPNAAVSAATSVTSTSFFSSFTAGEGSVSKGRSLLSAGKPPLAGHKRKPCPGANSDAAAAAGGRCHCSKKRKNRVKKTIRVPAISSRVADIPPDEHSWRKYGQKPIKGSPYPRGYYRCSTVRGCPARKHVERATDDPTMLIVTYEGEHRHALPEAAAATLPLTAAADVTLGNGLVA